MLTLIFGTWLNIAAIHSIGDVQNYYGTNKWGCSVLYNNMTHVLVENKKCYDVGKEIAKYQ